MSIPWHLIPSRWYLGRSQTESLFHPNSEMIQRGALSRCLDAHRFQYTIGLGRALGGEGIGRYDRLLSSPGITNLHSTCTLARYLICGRCSFSSKFAAIHQQHDGCWMSHQDLKFTPNFRLDFNGNGIGIDIDIGIRLLGYSDSDWANDSMDRKSQGRHRLVASNGTISWQSRHQSLIAISSLEAEFSAARRPPENHNGFSNCKLICTVLRETHQHC